MAVTYASLDRRMKDIGFKGFGEEGEVFLEGRRSSTIVSSFGNSDILVNGRRTLIFSSKTVAMTIVLGQPGIF